MLQQYNSKNDSIKVFIGDKLYNRADAKISVFDSLVQGGDGVWEGIRIYNGKVFCLYEHIDRMLYSAKALNFSDIPSRDFIKEAIFKTLEANGMNEDAHIRMTLSRGEKITSGMDPRLNQKGSTLIVLAEWKPPVYDNNKGIKLVTSSIRRNNPMFLDSHIHHNNLLNNILAKIEANFANCDDALMLDKDGFVAETNATNLFFTYKGELYTPLAKACLNGITRGLVMKLAKENNIVVNETDLSLTQFYGADSVFTTGTMGELTPVHEIDGRIIENTNNCTLYKTINSAFREYTETNGEPLPF